MSITSELREWWVREFPVMDQKLHKGLTAIADRIDAEHERLMQEQPFTIDMVPMTDERMAEHGWIRLPVDADGEYIRIGDVMEFSAFEVGKPPTRMVDGIGQGVFFAWCGERGYQQHEAKRYRHYHAPTVEDVLREMLDAWGELPSNATNEAIIAEYAKRLTLAEGEDA